MSSNWIHTLKQRLDARGFKPGRAEMRGMERLLDEHMPTGKGGRGAILWTLIGLLSGIAVSGFYLGFQDDASSGPPVLPIVLERGEGSLFRSNQDTSGAPEAAPSSSTDDLKISPMGVINQRPEGTSSGPEAKLPATGTVTAVRASASTLPTNSAASEATATGHTPSGHAQADVSGKEHPGEDLLPEGSQTPPVLPETETVPASRFEELVVLPAADPFSPGLEKPTPVPHGISPEIPVRQFFRFLTGWNSLSAQALFSGNTYEVDLRLEKPVGRGKLGLGIGYGQGAVELANGGTWEFSETSFWQVDTTGFVYEMDSVWVIDSINLGHWGYYPVDTLALTDSTKQVVRDSTLNTTRLVSQVYLPLHYDFLFSRGRWQFCLGAEATFSRLSYTLGEGEGQQRENLHRYTVGARLGVSCFLTTNLSAGVLWRPRYLMYTDPKFLSGWQPGAAGVSLSWHF